MRAPLTPLVWRATDSNPGHRHCIDTRRSEKPRGLRQAEMPSSSSLRTGSEKTAGLCPLPLSLPLASIFFRIFFLRCVFLRGARLYFRVAVSILEKSSRHLDFSPSTPWRDSPGTNAATATASGGNTKNTGLFVLFVKAVRMDT